MRSLIIQIQQLLQEQLHSILDILVRNLLSARRIRADVALQVLQQRVFRVIVIDFWHFETFVAVRANDLEACDSSVLETLRSLSFDDWISEIWFVVPSSSDICLV